MLGWVTALQPSSREGRWGSQGCGVCPPPPRAILKWEKGGIGNTNRHERSRERSLLHGQDMGKTQNHRNSFEQWLAVGGGWRLVVLGGCP